jgi:acetyl esterase/lipase
MLRKIWGLVLALPAFLAACSPAGLVNALMPRDDFRLVADLPYGDAARQKLDIYQPLGRKGGTDAGRRPVVVFFYGGNWQTGSKSDYAFLGESLAAKGFVVVLPDYRLYPEVKYPAFLDDGANAVRWTFAHIAEYGGDPARVSLMGHSAGGYIAVMLAVDPAFLGDARAKLRSVVGLAGPYDFLPLTDPALIQIFGGTDVPLTQPLAYADGTAPPALLATGRLDAIVSPGNTTRLAARISAKGGAVETRYYTLLSHLTLIGAFAKPLRAVTPVRDDVVDFLTSSQASARGARLTPPVR